MKDVSLAVERPPETWLERAALLWEHRSWLWRYAAIALVFSIAISLLIPKQYKSTASIMPPSTGGMSAAVFAALAGKSLGGLGSVGSLAGSLFGLNNSTALFVELLRSGSINGRIVERFDLQRVYRKRLRVDTMKTLARRVTIRDDKKSGVISITVEDRDPVRARDMAAAYLKELDLLLNRTSASSARQERIFLQKRLQQARLDLAAAQENLSEFSSTHSTIDLKEQARAEVSAATDLQAQILLEEANVASMRQIYGDGNVRLRAAEARKASLRDQLTKLAGSPDPLDKSGQSMTNTSLAPSLRQLPRLAVPFGDRYREVQIQEKLFELLTEQYEMARISEARDTPVISVIDYPGVPEKKSFPPRLLLSLGVWLTSLLLACAGLVGRTHWQAMSPNDLRKQLLTQILASRVRLWGHS
jgi:capsule polysaccharide export protein KpsE/RkpR